MNEDENKTAATDPTPGLSTETGDVGECADPGPVVSGADGKLETEPTNASDDPQADVGENGADDTTGG